MTRFPTYPKDILSRADALLSARYGTDKPIDPLLVEIACEAMMAQREVDAKIADEAADRQKAAWDKHVATGKQAHATSWEAIYRGIAKAIRGTK